MRIAAFIMTVSLAGACASTALAQAPKESRPADKQPETALPAGWTEADMKACTEAGTPGEHHRALAASVGTWKGKTRAWMAPDTEPMASECTMVVSDFMDGRFTRWEMSGEVPGMGPMKGMGLYGYDNVARKFVATWVTNCGTNILNGTGERSSDGSTFIWTYSMLDPITKKSTTLRDVERHTGPDTIVLETWGSDSKSGKEFRIMEANLVRTAGQGEVKKVSSTSASVGCAMCVFHMDGSKKCELAVKLDGKTYLVDGATVAGHEWCERELTAVVDGAVRNGRFVAAGLKVK